MATPFIESLESRRLFSAATPAQAHLHPALSNTKPLNDALSPAQVNTILGQAASQATGNQAVAVVDREGTILGIFARPQLLAELNGSDPALVREAQRIIILATARARTVAFFQSSGEAFTTRTARFIIQDHFPPGVKNTPGGPLYGVEFSSLIGTDILLPTQTPAISGDPGGIPLYVGDGIPAGGVGVAGDFHDVAPRSDLLPPPGSTPDYNANPKGEVYSGTEESDFDEAVALAGAKGFMAPEAIRATHIFVAGLRFPFTHNTAAHANATQTVNQLAASGGGALVAAPFLARTDATVIAGQPEIDNATYAGVPGLLRDESNKNPDGSFKTNPQSSDPVRPGLDGGLTVDDVNQVITDAVHQATITRAGIRKPNGVNAVVHVVVVDTQGNVLGAFRMHDGTNFSYDVAVQKARTAAFFSDDTHALSCRAVGFMSQKFFVPGLPNQGGPLFHVQDELDVADNNGIEPALKPQVANTPVKNGITIFPGGEPLYKDGKLVGAVGVSGDGVDQDDIISFAGTANFRPPDSILSDHLAPADRNAFVLNKLAQLQAAVPMSFDAVAAAQKAIGTESFNKVRLPYVKFPRQPLVGQ